MEFSKEMGLILFDGYYEGGGTGKDGKPSPKVRLGTRKPKPYEIAKREYQWLLGKIKQSIVLTDYDDDEIFQCRLKMAQALDQHCIAIKGAHKGGHIYWANATQGVVTSNTKKKTVLTLSPVDYKCGVKMIRSTGVIKPGDSYGALQNDDGSFREVLYFNPGEGGILDELPFYDTPLQSGEKHQFLGMAEGDGRQDGLFTYMIPMKGAGFAYEQYETAADLINRFVFAEPLASEFDNAKRREAWDNLPIDSDSKKPVNPQTFRMLLTRKGMSAKYNELLNLVEFFNIPKEFRAVNDFQNIMPTLLMYAYREYTGNKSITKQQVIDLIALVADENSYNPVRDYLQGLTWDGVDRFPALYEHLHVTGEFEQTLIKKWFIQTAAIPFNNLKDKKPFGAEGVLIFQGKEGIGKTRFFASLVADPLWFKSLDKPMSTKNKDTLIDTLSAWITEIGEIDRTFAENRSDLKNFMTATKDTIRKPYAREPVTKARITSFCGTTNKLQFLTEETGSRRWWVVPIPQKIDLAALWRDVDKNQLWAQAYQHFKEDPRSFRLTEEEVDTLKTRNEDATELLPAEDELRLRLDFDAPMSEWIWVQPAALSSIPALADVAKYDARTIGKALGKIAEDVPGIRFAKRNGVRKWFIPPVIENIDRFRNKVE